MDSPEIQELAKEFPDQFAPDGTPCWSECPKGWIPLVREVMQYVKDNGIKLKWAQIKEKFGGLRLYESIEESSPIVDIYDKIHTAEKRSFTTCQDCGNNGQQTTVRNWCCTLCLSCKNKRIAH